MKVWNTVASAAIAFAAFTATANADVVFDNIDTSPTIANCTWQCLNDPNQFGAQKFTLSNTTTIDTVAFTTISFSASAATTSVNYIFLSADGSGGLPGTHLAAGNSAIAATNLGPWVPSPSANVWLESFNVSGVTLVPARTMSQ